MATGRYRRTVNAERRVRAPWIRGLAWGGGYFVAVMAIAVSESISEHNKLAGGSYTDTVDALIFTRLAMLPLSLLVPPTAKDDLGALTTATWQLIAVGVIQALVVAAIAVTRAPKGAPSAAV
jgi:hypothetical protein